MANREEIRKERKVRRKDEKEKKLVFLESSKDEFNQLSLVIDRLS